MSCHTSSIVKLSFYHKLCICHSGICVLSSFQQRYDKNKSVQLSEDGFFKYTLFYCTQLRLDKIKWLKLFYTGLHVFFNWTFLWMIFHWSLLNQSPINSRDSFKEHHVIPFWQQQSGPHLVYPWLCKQWQTEGRDEEKGSRSAFTISFVDSNTSYHTTICY